MTARDCSAFTLGGTPPQQYRTQTHGAAPLRTRSKVHGAPAAERTSLASTTARIHTGHMHAQQQAGAKRAKTDPPPPLPVQVAVPSELLAELELSLRAWPPAITGLR